MIIVDNIIFYRSSITLFNVPGKFGFDAVGVPLNDCTEVTCSLEL